MFCLAKIADSAAISKSLIQYRLAQAAEQPYTTQKSVSFFAEEIFDAPCKNLGNSEKLDWRAYTYLVDLPSGMNNNQLVFLAGFSWGYSENKDGDIQLLDFAVLSEDNWLEHQKYALL